MTLFIGLVALVIVSAMLGALFATVYNEARHDCMPHHPSHCRTRRRL